MSLRTRVAVAVGVVVFCALAIVAAVVYPAVGANLRGKYDQSLVQVAREAPTIAAKLKQARTPFGQLVPFGDTQLQILPAAVVGPTNGFVGITEHDVQVADGNDKPYFHDEAYGSVVYRIYTMQFQGNSGTLVRVAVPVSYGASTQTALGWLLAVLIPAGAIGAAVVARLAAGRVLRPVGRLTETVERIRATGDLSVPIQTPGQDEISRLGQAFAAMTAALDKSVGAQRRLVADASHELRTPLTSLITNLELLAERPDDPSAPALAAAALTEAGELRVLINNLVELARDGQASFPIEDVRLDLVAERVAARAAGRAPGLRYELDCRPTLVRGDPDWKTASNLALKLVSRSCSTNLTRMPASSRSIRRFRGLLYHPGLDRVLRGSENPDPAAAVPGDGQDVYLGAVEQAGGEEVQRQDRLCLGSQECGASAAVRCGRSGTGAPSGDGGCHGATAGWNRERR